MEVSAIMTAVVQRVTPYDTLAAAARLMAAFDIGCLPVCAGDRLVGMVTGRDLVVRGLAEDDRRFSLTVAQAMSPDPVFCLADDTVVQAAHIMANHRVRRLPVLDGSRRMVGLVSLGDVCTHAPPNIAGELVAALSCPEHHALAVPD